ILLYLIFIFTCIGVYAGIKENPESYNVKEYGAHGTGNELDTEYIQKAIDDCGKNGGGTVFFPPGTFLSGTLYLKDNVNIHLSKGATLLGSPVITDYPENNSDYHFYNSSVTKHSLIYGENLSNISIVGEGVIDGQGGSFPENSRIKPDRYKNRPFIIRLIRCDNITIKDITLKNSAMWMQHYLACDHLRVQGIKVYNHCNKNNDMIDIDGCHDVIISDCFGDTDDDGITFKSTSARSCKNISVSNCVISSHCNAIKFGTESSGGFENITVSNCIIRPSKSDTLIYGKPAGISGISLEVVDGGIMDGINISDIIMDGPEVPVFVRLGNRGRKYKEEQEAPLPGVLRNVRISNIIAKNAGITGCSISGIVGNKVENVSLENIYISYTGGSKDKLKVSDVPEMGKSYPEATMFGTLPSYGLFIRHVNGIFLKDIKFDYVKEDNRSAVICEDVSDVTIQNLNAKAESDISGLILLKNIKNAFIHGNNLRYGVNTYISIEGEQTLNINVSGNNLKNAENIFKVNNGALEREVNSKSIKY
ncbi:MAG: hypothetical protein J7L04_03330, partial [Bacteroidales bacterium]|nr:hypothetical protein [Bacteroidales bacterium]